MKQECVYFHTDKGLIATEKEFREQGMEIVFRSSNTELKRNDLAEEEKNAWDKFTHEENKESIQALNKYDKSIGEFIDALKILRSGTKTTLELYHRGENLQKLKKSVNKLTHPDAEGNAMSAYHLVGGMEASLQNLVSINNDVNCACIIAKKGNTIVRYIKFLKNKDPVITITGTNASRLKTTLKEKL